MISIITNILSGIWALFKLFGKAVKNSGGIFSSLNSGIQFYIRMLAKISLFAAFAALIIEVINYFTSKITSFSLDGMDSCTAYAVNQMAIFPALSVFLKIVMIGFFAKHVIAYWRGI